MRPVEFQPPLVQAPNVERAQHQQQTQPQVAQQAFAGQLQTLAERRLAQVLPFEHGEEAHKADLLGEDRGEKRRRRGKVLPGAILPEEDGPGGDIGHMVDVRV